MNESLIEKVSKEEIGSAWSMIADLGNGRQISVNWNCSKGADSEALSKESDKYRGVLDRQQAKSACRGAADHIEKLASDLENALGDLARIDAKKKDNMSANERQQREAAVAYIDKLQKDIENKRVILGRLEAEAK